MYLTKQSADALTESTHTLVVPYSSTRPLPVRPPPPIPLHPRYSQWHSALIGAS
jgi:hypothetical protein